MKLILPDYDRPGEAGQRAIAVADRRNDTVRRSA
jgi:hypothetical protein